MWNGQKWSKIKCSATRIEGTAAKKEGYSEIPLSLQAGLRGTTE